MSRSRGLKALNLEMTDKIPHTEYMQKTKYMAYLTDLSTDDPKLHQETWKKIDLDFNFMLDRPQTTGPLTKMGRGVWSGSNMTNPEIVCPFQSVEEVLNFDPVEAYGVPDIDEQTQKYRNMVLEWKRQYPNAIIPGGLYQTCVSFCIDAFGWDLFLSALGTDPERFNRVMDGMSEIISAYTRAWSKVEEIDCFLTHDDITWTSGPFYHTDWYRKQVFPRYKKYWQIIHEAGKKVLYCSDGNWNTFLNDLVNAGADGFLLEPVVDLEQIVRNYGKTHIIIGNADCRILTFQTKEDIRKEIDRCVNLGRDCPGYFFAFGNHLPDNIPLEHIIFAMDYFEQVRGR